MTPAVQLLDACADDTYGGIRFRRSGEVLKLRTRRRRPNTQIFFAKSMVRRTQKNQICISQHMVQGSLDDALDSDGRGVVNASSEQGRVQDGDNVDLGVLSLLKATTNYVN